ncbi:uncharacterized protein BYT42DRAFT_568409 [Radiomyces spectabilis]|uniref:uncharacterized protein n=1 Tax=Radiomyces spectabilis TaxID=64574 RepID=UPI00221FF20C|nr:uncharacterized protein BYT42DRAFT_568409 [Radiomyces spectabilis]KAI8379320.1 hypothetical protein BYT42DRAFT_568409 [Radiomyces spectabilis]
MPDDEILQKIWKLTNELASQQQTNQEMASDIRSQLSDLKQRANALQTTKEQENVNSSMFNHLEQDVSADLAVACILAKHNDLLQQHQTVMTHNEELQAENYELKTLLREYEAGLETVASKLRNYGGNFMNNQLRMRREYEALLDAEKVWTT